MRVMDAVTIDDLRRLAKRRLPRFAFTPMDTGAGDGSAPAYNIARLRERRFRPRILVDVSGLDSGAELFGRRYAAPFGVSAIGYAGALRRHADQMLAEAARAANLPFMLSGGATASVEEICRIAPGHVWQQLYSARDPQITASLIGRAADAGVEVLVYTADTPLPPKNDWLMRTGVRLPAAVPLRSWPMVAWEAATHPAWTLEYLSQGPARLEGWADYAPPGADALAIARIFQSQVPSPRTWADLETIRRAWPGRLIVKGVVAAADARRAIDLGADAVAVSNHGGNKLDCMVAPIDALADVVEASGDAPVLFDGGIRRGSDLVIAAALGAGFSFVGRAPLYGVIAGGLTGAAKAIDILKAETAATLTHIGCASMAKVGPEFLA
jgi:(S)-mandelate dehydrogenase